MESAGETRIEVGKRFNTAQVVCHATVLPYELADWIVSDGRWRVVYFCGDIRNSDRRSEMDAFGDYLAQQLVPRFTAQDQDFDSVIEVLTVSATPRAENEMNDYHEALRPRTTHPPPTADGSYNISPDYHKILVDDETYHQGHGQAYLKYGLRKDRGTLVVIRPDGYVSLLVEARHYEQLGHFFSKILLSPEEHLTHQHTRKKRQDASVDECGDRERGAEVAAAAGLPKSTLEAAHAQRALRVLLRPPLLCDRFG